MVLCTIGLTRLLIIRNASCRSINPRPFNAICCVPKSNNKAGKKQHISFTLAYQEMKIQYLLFSQMRMGCQQCLLDLQWSLLLCAAAGVVWMWHGMFRLQHCEKAANESISVISILFEQAIEKCELQ